VSRVVVGGTADDTDADLAFDPAFDPAEELSGVEDILDRSAFGLAAFR
jgi:hypothetical protein